ncbi:MAG: hypothetical protein GY724_13385 [Actinomycetia bacterium]|nr:hypothetical protein [Actinomycetes bacterium]
MTAPGSQPPPDGQETDDEKWPIGFMTILGFAALYLAWRMVQAVAWLIDKI